MAPAPAPSTTPTPARAPEQTTATPAPAPVPAPNETGDDEWRPVRQVRPAHGVLNPDGSLPTTHADGTPLNSAEWAAQFRNYWYWNDGARLTGTEATRLRATLDPRPRAGRPRGAATGPRGDDPSEHAANLISANLVHQSALFGAIRSQGGMCITHDCQFEAQVLVNGNAYCSFACHTARAPAHAHAPAVRSAPAADMAAHPAAHSPTPPTVAPRPAPEPAANGDEQLSEPPAEQRRSRGRDEEDAPAPAEGDHAAPDRMRAPRGRACLGFVAPGCPA